MIYFDNAATTLQKPACVVQAVANALCSLGNSGRSIHSGAMDASRVIFEARQALAQLFGAESPDRIAFTANATEALNMAIKGILNPGDHVITTALEHNSVLRPLYEMEDRGVELTILPADALGRLRYADFETAIRPNTRAIVCTHGSNLTGNLVDLRRVGEIAQKHGLLFVADASQTAGVLRATRAFWALRAPAGCMSGRGWRSDPCSPAAAVCRPTCGIIRPRCPRRWKPEP